MPLFRIQEKTKLPLPYQSFCSVASLVESRLCDFFRHSPMPCQAPRRPPPALPGTPAAGSEQLSAPTPTPAASPCASSSLLHPLSDILFFLGLKATAVQQQGWPLGASRPAGKGLLGDAASRAPWLLQGKSPPSLLYCTVCLGFSC